MAADGPGRGAVVVPDLNGLKVGWAEAALGRFKSAVLGKPVPCPGLASLTHKWEVGLEVFVLGRLRERGFDGRFVEGTGTREVR